MKKTIKNFLVVFLLGISSLTFSQNVGQLVSGVPALLINSNQIKNVLQANANSNNYSITNLQVTDLFIDLNVVDGTYWLTYKFSFKSTVDNEIYSGSECNKLIQNGDFLEYEQFGGPGAKVTCVAKNCTGCVAKRTGCSPCEPPVDDKVVPECTATTTSGGGGGGSDIVIALIAALGGWLLTL